MTKVSELVTLRNGTKEHKEYVESIAASLKKLYSDNQLLFYGLVMICKNPEFKPFGTSKDILKQMMFLEKDGLPSTSIKNIVLSCVNENDPMKFIHPIV